MTSGSGPGAGRAVPAARLGGSGAVDFARGGRTGQWLDTAETDGLIVVAANPDQAGRLAGASTQGKLFFVLVGSGTG